MSWEWLIAPVLGVLALIFGFDARNQRKALGEADERRKELERRVALADRLALKAGVPQPTLDELDRVSEHHAGLGK